MSLKEILKLRNNCPICQNSLELVSVDLPGLSMKYTGEQVHIWLSHKPTCSITFNVDGTFQKTKQWNMDWVQPLSLARRCLVCGPEDIVIKGRAVGPSTQIGEKKTSYKYEQSFNLYRPLPEEDPNTYYTLPIREYLIFIHKGSRYIITNDLEEKEARIKVKTIDSLSDHPVIYTKLIDLSNIESFTELVRKIKIYQLFS